MFKSLIYKEWLKTRWFLAGFLLLSALALSLMFLKVYHDLKFNGGTNYWNNILFLGFSYFASFKFVPLIGGIIIGFSQYFPETVEKRLKLTFHLPVNENKILLQMMSYGTIILSLAYLFLLIILLVFSTVFFPREIIIDALMSMTPWFLSGYASYYLVGLIVLEPIWKYRFVYTVISAFYVLFYHYTAMVGAYASLNIMLTIFTMALSISVLFSGYRFRKGEQ